ncbi:hypothetical protein I2F27_09550 [Acinetobacter sp. B5B]|uniref:hypothetical protein n=1 Tax=Acinetobacter baretiae TaxID=2605383 RepID=UPI0018C20808|nr:hypothetical protein [Acinetobacter baretiae]MBF7683564.1 hypothetical protein [Acinetobacter baretiae]MBF7686340.1 hypothetical protein [Acinetobacter baretiae]
MLEELQRLQTHFSHLKHRLSDLETEHTQLKQEKQALEQRSASEISTYKTTIAQKTQEIDTLSVHSADLESKHETLKQDAKVLIERYNRLEKGCNDLKNRFQEILAERNELRVAKEKLQHDLHTAQQKIDILNDEQTKLVQKNEHAKVKVEEIIERLRILGTAEDKNTQALEQITLSNTLEGDQS